MLLRKEVPSPDTIEVVRRAIIASDVSPEALEPNAWRALRSLGYEIVPGGASVGAADQPVRPNLRIVDEEGFRRLGAEEGSSPPVIVVARRPASPPADRRIIAWLTRPASFRELYTAIQEALEPTPRRHPRVTTALPARCAHYDRSCAGAVISLSEGGCLFRSPEALSWERETNLQFSLPRPGLISTRAQQVNQRGSDQGFAFRGLPSESRVAISQYVMDRLIRD